MTDERAVSIPMQYVLLLTVVALLSAGLYASTGGYVESQHAGATHDALTIVGNRLATDIAAADRLAASLNGSGNLTVRATPPRDVAGSTYTIAIQPGPTPDRSVLLLETASPDVTVRVAVVTDVPLATGRISGGPVSIVSDGSQLEVRDA